MNYMWRQRLREAWLYLLGAGACTVGRHHWVLVGDWREGGYRWSGDAHRTWGYTHDYQYSYAGSEVKVMCARCRSRTSGRLRIVDRHDVWERDIPLAWELVTRAGDPVAGGPTHDEVERELSGRGDPP